ncbi:MAG: hypothetical protein P8Y64_02480 [Gammaproteobacteria bacterium]
MSDAATHARAILYHKQSTSALTRFMRLPYGGVCALGTLPTLVELGEGEPDTKLVVHPTLVLSRLRDWMDLPDDGLEHDIEFRAWLDTPDGPLPVHLVRFTGIDPPFAEAERIGAGFITLTEARTLPPVELQLLQQAYRVILG